MSTWCTKFYLFDWVSVKKTSRSKELMMVCYLTLEEPFCSCRNLSMKLTLPWAKNTVTFFILVRFFFAVSDDLWVVVSTSSGLKTTPAEIKQGFKRAFASPWPEKLRYQGDGRPFWKLVVSEATGCSDNDYFEEVYQVSIIEAEFCSFK